MPHAGHRDDETLLGRDILRLVLRYRLSHPVTQCPSPP